MNNRFELLRWINRRYPKEKVNSIEQLSDGRHFLLILSELFPSIDSSKLQRGVNLLQRIQNMRYVNSQFEMLGINIKVEVNIQPLSLQISKIANKNTLSIINLLKQLISYVEANNRDPDILIIEEPQQQQSEFQEEQQELRMNIVQQPYQQEMNHDEVSLLLIRIKEMLLSNMSHRDLQLELVKLVGDENDQDLVKLSHSLNNQLEEETHSFKKISKITNYESLRSSKFYQNGDNNILESQFSFSQPRTSWDSLFFVSDCKPNDQN